MYRHINNTNERFNPKISPHKSFGRAFWGARGVQGQRPCKKVAGFKGEQPLEIGEGATPCNITPRINTLTKFFFYDII
jgi:hypothetical protein